MAESVNELQLAWNKAKSLIGMPTTVKVILDLDDPNATVTGKIVGLTDDGQVTILMEDGVRHYCWPLLRVEEVS
jgi:hypothetical protein